jgi:TolB protein
VSTDTSPPPRLAQVTFGPGIDGFPSLLANGRELLFSGEVGGVRKIFRTRTDGTGASQLTKGPCDDIQPAWSPDGRSALFVRSREPGRRLEPADVFGQFNGADVWTVDLASGQETRLVEDAYNPDFGPEGGRIAVDASWAGPRRIWVVDPRGRNPVQVSSDSSEAVAHLRPRWSPDGSRIVFQNLERTKFDLRVLDLAGGRLSWLTNDLFQDLNPVWSPSGRFVFFSSNRGGGLNIWALPVTPAGEPTGPPRQLTTGAGQDVEIAVSPAGRRLAFSILRQNADLWRLPVEPATGRATGAPQPVVASSREESRGAWSPDGGVIAFNCDRAGDMNIWLYTLADGSLRQLTRGPGGDYQPNWSPDGRTIAFFSSRNGCPGIWTVGVATGRVTPLSRGRHIEVNPFFSPDGRHIAYQSDRAGRLEVWVMDADGSQPRELTNVGVSGHFLRWTADGRWIVFRCPGGGAPRTMRVPLEAGEPEPLAEVQGGAHMSFSPNGSRIMDVVAHKALWVSPLAGDTPERVFEFDDPDVRIDYPVWSPDGRWVLFDRFRPQGGDVWVMESFE